MSLICHIDQTEHESLDQLHAHLRRFKVKQADYYLEYFKRQDLLTGELIPYKDYSQYFSQDFVNKHNLKKWLKLNPEKGAIWAKTWLKNRKEEKSLIYAPSYVELKSLNGPSMEYFEYIGGYDKITKELGFLDRYNNCELKYSKIKDLEIIVDTREQKELKLPCKSISKKLDYADYSISLVENTIFVERKSLNDFVGTLSSRKISKKSGDDSNYDRLQREIDRAVQNNHYIVMMVEESLQSALSFDYLPQMKWSKVKPSHIFKNLRDLLNKYPLNFQVIFVNGRIDAVEKLIKIFELKEQVRTTDLQWAIEKGKI